MDRKKDLTKELLADCFHELMLGSSFDRITIKMITDRAGLIRPTFYKHFQDKYEVLEWIFKTEVEDSVNLLIDNRMEGDAVLMFCRCMEKDRKFYRKAYLMEPGPNSFENIVTRFVFNCFLRAAKGRELSVKRQFPYLTNEMLANHYTYSIVYGIRDWIVNENEITADQIAAAYSYFLTHSLKEMIISGAGPV